MARGRKFQRQKKKVSRHVRKSASHSKPQHSALQSDWSNQTLSKNYKTLGLATDANALLSTSVVSLSSIARKRHRPEDQAKEAPTAKDTEDRPESQEGEGEKVTSKRSKVCSLVGKWDGFDQEVAITGKGTRVQRQGKNYLTEEDMLYIKPLVEKYGDDTEQMFRDIRLNYYQKSQGWLKKHVTKYVNLTQGNK